MRWLWLTMLLLWLSGTVSAAELHLGSTPYACTTDCWSGSPPQATAGPTGWLDPPANAGAYPDPLLLTEAIRAGHPFVPEARDQMDWRLPADFYVACATWGNEGLTWLYLDDHEAWGATIQQPSDRSCGIAEPIPEDELISSLPSGSSG